MQDRNTVKLGSLFDGIGGWCLAAIHAGILPVWSSEIERFPLEVTKRRFPYVAQLGDITKIDASKIELVDIICAGSPCQDLSIAGKREGLQGERSGLFRTAIDIVRQMRMQTDGKFPRFFVWENVPGAFSSNKGLDFLAVLEEVCESKVPVPEPLRWANAGVVECRDRQVAWRVLDAQYWGVPQRRKRIFLVADFGGRCAGEILFEPQGVRGDIAESGSERKGVAEATETSVAKTSENVTVLNDQGGNVMATSENLTATLRAEAHGNIPVICRMRGGKPGGGKGPLLSYDRSLTLSANTNAQVLFDNHPADSRITGPLDVAATVSARYGTGGGNVPLVLDKTYCIAGNTIDRQIQNGGNGRGVQENISYTLNTVDRHAVVYCIGNGQVGQLKMSSECGALNCMHDQQSIITLDRAAFNQGANAKYDPQVRADGKADTMVSRGPSAVFVEGEKVRTIRRLTPLECERLQGLPDNWTLINDKSCSDSARYKAIGNGMAQPCADWILKRIMEVAYEKA